MKLPLFNKNQREGLAKVADNVATASVVSALIGGWVDEKIGMGGVLVLVFLTGLFLYCSYILRKEGENGD
jgi:hypothetical protein